jgi:uncharacterized RDD family membrane protein YckC
MTGREKTLIIQTPEGVVFPLIIASPIVRFLALVIDIICVYCISGILSGACKLLGLIDMDIAGAFWMVLSFALSFGYFILFEWMWRGQTLGKRMLHLRVIDEQGLRLQASQVVIRNLLRAVDCLPALYLVGGIASFLSPHGKRLGDIAANTIVVSQRTIAEPDLDQILPGNNNSFREYPHLAARLRQNVLPREAGIALQALMRRDSLDDDARLSLFALMRAHMEGIARFPAVVTDGVSDEQYVRNVADILFR